VTGFLWPFCRFDDLFSFVRQSATMEKASVLLKAIRRGCIERHGCSQSDHLYSDVNVRIFLSAYMIAYHPSKVFETIGPLEARLQASVGPLLETFDAIRSGIKVSWFGQLAFISKKVTRKFIPLLSEYSLRFKEWKIPDERKVICRMKHALIALYTSELLVNRGNIPVRNQFAAQIGSLRAKFRAIAGQEALDAFDEETRGMRMDSGAGGSSPVVVFPGQGGGPPAGHGGGLMSFHEMQFISGNMTNEELAHEILYDPCFQLGDDMLAKGLSKSTSMMKEIFERAFWDSLVDDFSENAFCRMMQVILYISGLFGELGGRFERRHIFLPNEKSVYITGLQC